MVWNTTQSSLYRAVSDYNDKIDRRGHDPRSENASDCSQTRKCSDHFSNDRSDNRRGAKKQHYRTANRCKKCAECPHCSERRNSPNGNLPNTGGLNIDRDFLLLVGLIFILSENGADKKLIAALAIALLG